MPIVPVWIRCVLALVIGALAWISWGSTVRTILTPPPSDILGQHDESFNNGTVVPPQRVEVAGLVASGDGWCLNAGNSGTLVYKFQAQHEVPVLYVRFYLADKGTNRISVSTNDGASYKVLSENRRHEATPLDLGGRVQRGQDVWLKFEGTNPTPNMALMLDELKIVYRDVDANGFQVTNGAVVGAFFSLGLAIVVLCRRWPLALSTLAILVLGVSLRFEALTPLLYIGLEPDAIGYRAFAAMMRPFGETGFFSARFGVREPMFIFVIHVYTGLFGDSTAAVRTLTVILSIANIWVTMRVGRALFGELAGQLIGLVVALNGPLIGESVRGLRLELEMLFLTTFFWLAFIRRWTSTLAAAVVLSLMAGLIASTRVTYTAGVAGLTLYALFRIADPSPLRDVRFWKWPGLRRAWPAMILSIAIVAAFVAPIRYNMYRNHGDPFYDSTTQTRSFANAEFAGRPGFPTAAELTVNAYIGPRITPREYLLGLHTPSELIVGMLRGSWKLFRHMEVCPAGPIIRQQACAGINATFQLLAGVGLALSLLIHRYRWIVVAFFVLELQVSFLFDRQLLELYRQTYPGLPLLLFAATLTSFSVWNVIVRRRGWLVAAQPSVG
jgi:hypothetical protein